MKLELFSMCVLILNQVHGSETTSGQLVTAFLHRVRTFAFAVAGRRGYRTRMNLSLFIGCLAVC